MTARARPLRADAKRNREHLLGVAREVFAAEGLEVPIDEIARRAGLGIGTVYRHFPTKEALFEAIVLDRLEQFVNEADALRDAQDPGAALVEFLERYSAAGAAKRDFIQALSRSGIDVMGGRARKLGKRIKESLGVLLARAQKAGAIRSDVGVEEILALLQGMAAANSGYAGLSDGRSRIWAVMLDGLRAPRAPKKKGRSTT
jgi:AcrR family transcriptional regulator